MIDTMNIYQKEVIENYVNSYNNFDINGMIKNLTNDVVFENISDGKVSLRIEGLNNFIKQAESAKQYFKERKQTIESWEFNESIVKIGINYSATLAIDFQNGLKKGDTLELNGISEFKFENNKIRSIRDKS